MLSGSNGGSLGLEEALGALIASEPFERLLLERARPIEAHAEAGVGRGDRGSRPRDGHAHPGGVARSARGGGARRRDRRVPGRRTRRVAARVGGAAVRGHRPDPRDRRPPRRRDPSAARGEGCVRGGRARARRDAGPDPHARRRPAARAGRGPRAGPRCARRPAGRPGLRASRSDRASRRVRGARRRRRRVPRRRAASRSAWSTGARRSNRSASSRRRRSSRPPRPRACSSRPCAS